MGEAHRFTLGEVAPPVGLRLRSAFLLLVMTGSLLPGCSTSRVELDRSMDEALLLALASHEQLELGQAVVRSGGGAWMAPAPVPFSARRTNPHRQLQSMYADFAGAIGEGGPGFDHFLAKAQEHRQAGDVLDSARARRDARRGRGFQRFIRGLAQAPVKVTRGVGQLLKGTLRVTGTVIAIAIEQAPQIARDIVMKKLQELRNLLQGRIDLAWDKVAAKLGLPFALWLRSKVDPAFVRVRDRVVAQVLGKDRARSGQGEEDPGASTSDGDTETEEDTDQARYGTWQVDPEGDPDDMGGYIKWDQHWTSLPSSFEDDCQPAPDGTRGTTIFSDDARFSFIFELDEATIQGKVIGSFDWEGELEKSQGSFDEEITNGWVRPAADGSGWEFGGAVEIDTTIATSIRCIHRTATEGGGTLITYYWRNQSKPLTTVATLSGNINQLVPGEEGEPDHLAPGGILWVDASIESEDLELAIFCMDCSVPDDLPPPFKVGDSEAQQE